MKFLNDARVNVDFTCLSHRVGNDFADYLGLERSSYWPHYLAVDVLAHLNTKNKLEEGLSKNDLIKGLVNYIWRMEGDK